MFSNITSRLSPHLKAIEADLLSALHCLTYPEDEVCDIELSEGPEDRIHVVLKRRRQTLLSDGWSLTQDRMNSYRYEKSFDRMSLNTIVDSVERLLAAPRWHSVDMLPYASNF